MSGQRLTSPCPSCHRWGDDMDECVTYCQLRVSFLHIAFGEPWIDCDALLKKHQKERLMFSPAKRWDFTGPGPNARTFNCPICGDEVQTSHHCQRTCNSGGCPKAYERLADAARKVKNKERDRAQNRKRKREKRMAGSVL